jgi:hypothetical protein
MHALLLVRLVYAVAQRPANSLFQGEPFFGSGGHYFEEVVGDHEAPGRDHLPKHLEEEEEGEGGGRRRKREKEGEAGGRRRR